MTTLRMTAEQTEIYDGSDDAARSALMATLRRDAQHMAFHVGHSIKILTVDGVVAEVVS